MIASCTPYPRQIACASVVFPTPQLPGERYEERRIDGPPEVLTPLAQLAFGELEVSFLGERGNEVPVGWHS